MGKDGKGEGSSMKDKGYWLNVQPANPMKKWRKWYGTFYITSDKGIFIPAVLIGNEMLVFMCMGSEGGPIIEHNHHIWVRLEWAKTGFYVDAPPPKYLETLEKLEGHIRKIIEETGG